MNMRSDLNKSITFAAILFLALGVSVPAQAGGGHYNGHGGHYYRHGGHYNGHHSRHNDEAAYLVGGLVLGSLLTHAYVRNQQSYYEDRTVVVAAPVVTQTTSRISRRLLRDRDGNCFEKNYNDRGDEILVELDPAECAW